MTKKAKKPRIYVKLTATWGNDDVESSIKISRRRWSHICAGEEYQTSASYRYEGHSYTAYWSFINGKVTIDGEDGEQHVLNLPALKLWVSEETSGCS
jgi:hypothetical protein